jgi:UDP-2-acetamido-3-amino-2,3-dideoxy-glucuronate N-acetyltransferase
MTNIYVHETAEISPQASIGDLTKVWNWTKVREEAIVGSNCNIGQCVYIDQGVIIGNNCKIQNGVQLYKGLTVGNGVFIGPNVTFTNDKFPRAENENWVIVKTLVEDGASIGAGAVIVCGITIGKNAMIGAGSVVTKDVAPNTLVTGNPATFVKRIDSNGQRMNSKQGSISR